MHISFVDVCPTPVEGTARDAFANAVALALQAEALGCRRYWVAEHHGSNAIASQAPEILIGHIAAKTSHIRVGSGAVLLNHYSPLKVAEQFRMLHALHPGRIDLGVGRAFAGRVADPALQRHRDSRRVDDYGDQVLELLFWMKNAMPADHPFATMDLGYDVADAPEMLLLGSSQQSPFLAAQLGLPYTFAGFISPQGAESAIRNYRENFRPSAVTGLDRPYVILAMHVVCADDMAEAERQAMTVRHMYDQIGTGKMSSRLASPDQAVAHFGGVIEAEDELWPRFVIGDPPRVAAIIGRMIERVQPDELMVQDLIVDHPARIRSQALLAGLFAPGRN